MRGVRIDRPLRHDFAEPPKQRFADAGNAAANDNNIWVQQADHTAEPGSNLKRQVVEVVPASFQHMSRSESFNTPRRSAAANGLTQVIDSDVSAFGSGSVLTVIDLPVENNSGSDTRSNRGVKHAAAALCRSEASLRQSGGITIVLHSDAQVKPVFHNFPQRDIVPSGQVWRVQDHARFRIEWTRSANPNSSYFRSESRADGGENILDANAISFIR